MTDPFSVLLTHAENPRVGRKQVQAAMKTVPTEALQAANNDTKWKEAFPKQAKLIEGELSQRDIAKSRPTTLAELHSDISDDMMVHFSQSENQFSIMQTGIIPNAHGYSHWFRYGDVKHFSMEKISALIGNLAAGGEKIDIIGIAKNGGAFKKFGDVPGTKISEYEISVPVPVETRKLPKSSARD